VYLDNFVKFLLVLSHYTIIIFSYNAVSYALYLHSASKNWTFKQLFGKIVNFSVA